MSVVAAAAAPSYIGAAACAKCHADIHRTWSESRHSKMLQPIATAGVKGDFTVGTIRLRGDPYTLTRRNGGYFITESYFTGKPVEHRVDYTLGSRRIQHYLTTLSDGRIIVLPPTWDVVRKTWFHNLDIDDPEETPGALVQIWNKNCYSCHVSQEQKNFDPATDIYKTAWLDFGTNCERCHGPGSDHAAHYSANPKARGPATDILVQTRLDAGRNTEVCAQCHSFRDIFIQGYSAGADYYDYFVPILEFSEPADGDAAYWADGRTRRFSNDAIGLWQSECYLKGKVTCLQCHVVPHNTDIDRNPQLRPDSNSLCTQCHNFTGKALEAHTHHPAASAGSSCIECHMPRTVLSIKAQIRDHSMSVPVPENTINHAIPNACNLCHKDRDAQWSLAAMNKWYGAKSRQKLIRRADAFAEARTGNPASIPQLLAILENPAEGALVRANAAGRLSTFVNDPRVFPALEHALTDPEPPVRAVAALQLQGGPAGRQAAIPPLVRALADPAATVRLAAGVGLVNLGVRGLPGEDELRLESARQLYRARAELNSDDAQQQLGAGRFYLLSGDPASAVSALESALKLDPEVPAEYFLAAAHLAEGQSGKAREILEEIPPTDSQYENAQKLLKAIDGRN